MEHLTTECGIVAGVLLTAIGWLIKITLTLQDRLDKRYTDILALVPRQTENLARLEQKYAEFLHLIERNEQRRERNP